LESLFNVEAFADDPDDCLRLVAGVTGSYSEPESCSGRSDWSRPRGSGDELFGATLPFAPRASERGLFTRSVGGGEGGGGVFEDCESGATFSAIFGETLGTLAAVFGVMGITIAPCLP
jgi:hypothetical protein